MRWRDMFTLHIMGPEERNKTENPAKNLAETHIYKKTDKN
jgi:hypothetical protein